MMCTNYVNFSEGAMSDKIAEKKFFSIQSSSPTDLALNKAVELREKKRYFASFCMVEVSLLAVVPSAVKDVACVVVKLCVSVFALTIGQIPPIKTRTWTKLQEKGLVSETPLKTVIHLVIHVYRAVMFIVFTPISCLLIGTFSPETCKKANDVLKLTKKVETSDLKPQEDPSIQKPNNQEARKSKEGKVSPDSDKPQEENKPQDQTDDKKHRNAIKNRESLVKKYPVDLPLSKPKEPNNLESTEPKPLTPEEMEKNGVTLLIPPPPPPPPTSAASLIDTSADNEGTTRAIKKPQNDESPRLSLADQVTKFDKGSLRKPEAKQKKEEKPVIFNNSLLERAQERKLTDEEEEGGDWSDDDNQEASTKIASNEPPKDPTHNLPRENKIPEDKPIGEKQEAQDNKGTNVQVPSKGKKREVAVKKATPKPEGEAVSSTSEQNPLLGIIAKGLNSRLHGQYGTVAASQIKSKNPVYGIWGNDPKSNSTTQNEDVEQEEATAELNTEENETVEANIESNLDKKTGEESKPPVISKGDSIKNNDNVKKSSPIPASNQTPPGKEATKPAYKTQEQIRNMFGGSVKK